MAKREKRFECLWYVKQYDGQSDVEAMQFGDYDSKDFYSRKDALNFYEKHKNDTDKCGWWVTRRDADWCVIEDIVY